MTGAEHAAGDARPMLSALVGSGATAAAILVGQLATGVGLVLVARSSDRVLFGQFAAVGALSLVVATLADFGSSQFATRELARGRSLDSFRLWLTRRTGVQLLVLPLVFVISRVWIGQSLTLVSTIGLIFQATTATWAQGCLAPVRGLGAPTRAAIYIALGNIAFIGGVGFQFLRGQPTLEVAGIGLGLSWVITGVLAISWWSKRLGEPSGSSYWSLNPWQGAANFGVMSIAVSGASLDTVLIRSLNGPISSASLAAVSRWTQPIGLVATAYAQFLFPKIAGAETDREGVRMLRLAMPAALLGVGAVTSAVALANQLVQWLLGPSYADSAGLVRLLAIGVLPALANQLLSMTLQARGAERAAARLVVTTTVIHLAFVAATSSSWGATAAPVGFLLTQITLLLALSRRVLRLGRSS